MKISTLGIPWRQAQADFRILKTPRFTFSSPKIRFLWNNYYLWSYNLADAMVKKCARHNIGLRKIFTDDGGILLQVLFTAAVISAGIFLKLNFLQWTIVSLLSLALLAMGLYRGAAKLLTLYDQSISLDQGIRIRAMGNILVAFTTGIAFFTYLIIFMPKINSLI